MARLTEDEEPGLCKEQAVVGEVNVKVSGEVPNLNTSNIARSTISMEGTDKNSKKLRGKIIKLWSALIQGKRKLNIC